MTTDPTPDELPGVRDFEVSIPVLDADDGPARRLIARLPAFDAIEAEMLGERIAERVSRALSVADKLGRYSIDPNGITVRDVDDQPSPAAVVAELEHYKRVLAALAAKLPLMLQLTADEYQAADPAGVQAVSVGDGMMAFVSAALVAEVASAAPADMQAPGIQPVLVPARDVPLPTEHGGHTDPDVRLAAPHTLARANPGEVDVLIDGVWYRLGQADIDQAEGTVTFFTVRGETTMPASELVPARPATIDAYGTDLIDAADTGQQVLTDTGWMQVETAEYMGADADAYKVSLSAGDESRGASYGHGDEILLRAVPVGWWA